MTCQDAIRATPVKPSLRVKSTHSNYTTTILQLRSVVLYMKLHLYKAPSQRHKKATLSLGFSSAQNASNKNYSESDVLTAANRRLYAHNSQYVFQLYPHTLSHHDCAVSLAGRVLYLFADIFIYLSVFSMQSWLARNSPT